MRYKHLSITEREKRLIHRAKGMSLCLIAKMLGRNKSTINYRHVLLYLGVVGKLKVNSKRGEQNKIEKTDS